jgi:hypothetical protein
LRRTAQGRAFTTRSGLGLWWPPEVAEEAPQARVDRVPTGVDPAATPPPQLGLGLPHKLGDARQRVQGTPPGSARRGDLQRSSS